MGQVFTIVMENAVRYGRKGGHLSIKLRREEGAYLIDFVDDGPGVARHFLPEMFQRFTREEASRARHSGGSGLGLSIARAIYQGNPHPHELIPDDAAVIVGAHIFRRTVANIDANADAHHHRQRIELPGE